MKAIKTILATALLLSVLVANAQTDTLPKAKTGKDTTKLNLGKTEVLIIEEKKTVTKDGDGADVVIEERIDSTVSIVIDSVAPSVRPAKKKKPSHVWMGFDLGVNTLLNADKNFSLTGPDAPYSLDYAKSISFSLNLYEKAFRIVKNNFYFSTGIGLEFNNYRFENKKVLLDPEASPLAVSYDTVRNITKNKLAAAYLNVPLLFTVAGNNKKGKNTFHVTVGGMVGWKYRSHQKVVYNDADGDKKKDKEFDSFNMNPFRFTAMARIGYKNIGLFANYSINPLFQKNKGPELYPLTLGLSFTL
jgi:hypothetical protein